MSFLIFLTIRSNKRKTVDVEKMFCNILRDNGFHLEDQVKYVLNEKGKEQAIKYVQENTGLGLLLAIDYVDYVMNRRI